MAKLAFPRPFIHKHPSYGGSSRDIRKASHHGTKGRRGRGKHRRLMATYVIVQSAVILFWCLLNVIAWLYHWDPYPFIFLNLVFSVASAYTAPLIMMSQNRQDEIDRMDAHNDYLVNQKMEQENPRHHGPPRRAERRPPIDP